MLKSIYLHNFKSFAKAELPLEQLTLMIGSNASGKSNALEALWILSDLALGKNISEILDGTKKENNNIRGGASGCPRVPFRSFELGCTYQVQEYKLEYRIAISVDEGGAIEYECLKRISKDKSETLFESIGEKNDKEEGVANFLSDRADDYVRSISYNPTASILSQTCTRVPTDGRVLTNTIKDVTLLVGTLSKGFFLQPDAHQMRNYVRISKNKLASNGQNVSSVLFRICENEKYKVEILRIISELPDNKIEDIDFITTKLNDVMLILKESFYETEMDARQLSDGTLRCLAILAAVYSEPEGSMIVVEELDNGLHPSRIAKLLHAIQQIAAERHLMLVVTTHNPAVMDAVDPDHMDGLVLCYRSKKDGASTFARIVDLPDYLRLVAKGTMGELAEQNAFVQSIYHPRERGKMSYTWLKEDVL